LGFIVKDGIVMPSDEKTIAIKHFPIPLIEGQYKVFWVLLAIFENLFHKLQLSHLCYFLII